MKKTILCIAYRVTSFAVIAALVCIGCSDNGAQNKNPEVGEFINMFVGGGARYTLSVNAMPPGYGTVSRNPESDAYKAGSKVAVKATPKEGYAFIGWSGTVSDANDSITITMNSNMTLTANFQEIRQYTLTAGVYPSDGGSVSRNPSQTNYTTGTTVTVTATAADGYTFTGWTGSTNETTESVTITMNSDMVLTANFQKIQYTLTTNVSPSGGGSVSRSPNQINYASGTNVTVTATAASGYTFTGWSGASTSTSSPVTITMNGDRTLTANFQQQAATYTLTTGVSPTGGGSVSRSPNQTSYTSGTSVTVTATAASGYTFTGWSGASSSTSSSVTITMNGDRTLTAVFAQQRGSATLSGNTLTDIDDYQTYRTVVIGGRRWMAENLNYWTSSGSWCYGNEDRYCEKYGRLYDWNTAITVCPRGWHLPFSQEWNDFQRMVYDKGGVDAAVQLKSTSDWGWSDSHNGTDSYGFSAMPGGYYRSEEVFYDINRPPQDLIDIDDDGDGHIGPGFYGVGLYGWWWLADYVTFIFMSYENDTGVGAGSGDGVLNDGFSVRCIQD